MVPTKTQVTARSRPERRIDFRDIVIVVLCGVLGATLYPLLKGSPDAPAQPVSIETGVRQEAPDRPASDPGAPDEAPAGPVTSSRVSPPFEAQPLPRDPPAAEPQPVRPTIHYDVATAQSALALPGDPSLRGPEGELLTFRLMTPASEEELMRRIGAALQRTPDALTPMADADLTNMPTRYEWGTGTGHRAWRRYDASTWYEVYPDGRYSVFPILGRATVNGMPGTIAAKDDGALEVFIPDKGGRMFHMIGRNGQWSSYTEMQGIE